ncbi:hypothetical protein GCM10010964_14090 [Caldovatus sediminis]|uniref:Glycine zipper domain-containing protein n=1 Tax=Caldovatus sediminis TaxID=2041189 RepID=A0A8J2Z9I3_9PROT|nr:hypothetical protein [Caldovatus sediminis]GGG27336.1 hypothetical protein GCM10010964_14090 [Caldovatus sediminis]
MRIRRNSTLLTVFALAGTVLAAGCTDPYGRVDPARTALLGAGIGAAAGLAGGAIAAESQRRSYYYGPGYYAPPPPGYYYRRPRYYYYGY